MEQYSHFPEVVQNLLWPYLGNERKRSQIQHILDNMPVEVKDSLFAHRKKFDARMREVIESKGPDTTRYTPIEEIPEHLKPGNSYCDFTGKTPHGIEINFSEFLRDKKLILLDFWASWCGPCIKEMPVIAGLHEKYKDVGLAVIGITSDSSEKNWVRAIEQYNMTWLQLISARQDIGELYSIKTIPYTVIIDGDGTILARKLRGEELVAKIDELMAR